ncbi:uncharacterized protein RCH25_025903 [Pelodytes ibericus]
MAAAPAKDHVTFDDVAVFFSEDEWDTLANHQRALYMEVMKDNYEHFIFLGYEVPVILSLLQDACKVFGEAACPSAPSSSPATDPPPLTIKPIKEEIDTDIPIHEESQASEMRSLPIQMGKVGIIRNSPKVVSWEDDPNQQNGEDTGHEEDLVDQPPAHGRNLRKRRQYFCPECESCFQYSSALEAHRRVHSGDRPHQCDICKETFSYKSALIVHRREHTQPSTSRVQNVQHTTPNLTNITPRPPMLQPAPRAPIQPPVTRAPVPPPLTRAPVLQPGPKPPQNGDSNPSLGDKPLQCSYCDKRFNDQTILEAHHRIHTGKLAYPCTMCEESFSKPSLLAAHNNTHREGKPYQCDRCDKNFNDQSLLFAHMRTHTGEKPHRCNHCQKWFPNHACLVVHEECHLRPKPYKCRHCEKSFNDKSLMITHEGVHTQTKPFKCTQCSESFFLKTQLTSHQATHCPDKPYPCSQCERSFNKKETLLAHIRVHNLQNVQKPRQR